MYVEESGAIITDPAKIDAHTAITHATSAIAAGMVHAEVAAHPAQTASSTSTAAVTSHPGGVFVKRTT